MPFVIKGGFARGIFNVIFENGPIWGFKYGTLWFTSAWGHFVTINFEGGVSQLRHFGVALYAYGSYLWPLGL